MAILCIVCASNSMKHEERENNGERCCGYGCGSLLWWQARPVWCASVPLYKVVHLEVGAHAWLKV